MNELEVKKDIPNDLMVMRRPDVVLAEAKIAATSLKDVLAKKDKPVIFNGQQYLEFEDWQTIGKFYGLLCSTMDPEEVTIGGVPGARANAEVIDIRSGQTVGRASAWCLRDEPNWKNKPWYQLASMAQTRAGAKALRNLLSWVVVLAGYKTTPAEEIDSHVDFPAPANPIHQEPVQQAIGDIASRITGVTKGWAHPSETPGVRYISPAQAKRFYAIAKSSGATDQRIKEVLLEEIGSDHSKMITVDKYEEVCSRFQSGS